MQQLAALGGAAALGAAAALVYDLLRALRQLWPALTLLADGLWAGLCLLGTLWALLELGGGEPQLYLLLGALSGAALYLLLAAPLLAPLWAFWAGAMRDFLHLLLWPLRLLCLYAKKIVPTAKKVFHFVKKYAILNIYKWKCHLRPGSQIREGESTHGKESRKKEKARRTRQAGRNAGHRGAAGRRHH